MCIRDSISAILDDTGTAGVVIAAAQTVATVTNVSTVDAIAANAITAAAIAVGAIEADAFAAGAINSAAVGLLDNTNFTHVDASERVDVGDWLGTPVTSGTGGPDINVNAIGDSTAAAVNLAGSALGIVKGTMSGTPSTTVILASDLPSAVNDTYIGRVIVITSGAATGEATDITAYVGSTRQMTVTALASTPTTGNTFVIV